MVATSVGLWLGSRIAINIKGIFVALNVISIWCVCLRVKYFIRGLWCWLAGLRRMFLFYVSHSVQTNTIKVGVAVTQHRIAPHLANKMIPPETSHVFNRIILIRALWDEMLNPFYIFIAPFVLFIALTQPDPQSRNRISKCRYANILQESTQMNAILTT